MAGQLAGLSLDAERVVVQSWALQRALAHAFPHTAVALCFAYEGHFLSIGTIIEELAKEWL